MQEILRKINKRSKVSAAAEALFWQFMSLFFSRLTRSRMKYDLIRFKARLRRRGVKQLSPPHPRLHVGCGTHKVQGWLNVDLTGSDYDLDLAHTPLPWKSEAFEAVVGEHFIEHLDLKNEILPFLCEVRRILISGGELWLSTPDIEKVCRSYLSHRMQDLLEDRKSRWPRYSLQAGKDGQYPTSQMINDLFHQGGSHLNLFDYPLLEWALTRGGFTCIERVTEADLLRRFPEFPPRNDDLQSLYVRAIP